MDKKWSLLYEYSRKSLDDEVNRFARLDEKAKDHEKEMLRTLCQSVTDQ